MAFTFLKFSNNEICIDVPRRVSTNSGEIYLKKHRFRPFYGFLGEI